MKTIATLLFLLSVVVAGQTQVHNNCPSDKLHFSEIRSSPDYAERAHRIEALYQKALDEAQKEDGPAKSGTIVTIPVVFHIMHTPGQAIGTGSNLSLARIQQEVANINAAFRNTGYYFGTPNYCNCNIPSADIEIEFCLATQDPAGFPTDGVTRYPNPYGNTLHLFNAGIDSGKDRSVDVRNVEYWPSDQYLNIWVFDQMCDFDSPVGPLPCGSSLALATFPETHGEFYDGILIHDYLIGANEANSTVLVHEIGHYFNLHHTFYQEGEICGGATPVDCRFNGDFVCDTPPDDYNGEATNCGEVENSCSNEQFDPQSPFYQNDVNDMYENYMDYGQLPCRKTFTPDQKTRMRAAIGTLASPGPRGSLLTSPGCQPPSVTDTRVAFALQARTVAEHSVSPPLNNDCRPFRVITFKVNISQDPAATLTLNFSGGGTATQLVDYQLLNPSVTFTPGGDRSKFASIRIFDDNAIEGDETIVLTYTIDGPALAADTYQALTITLKDNDRPPGFVLFDEDFEGGSGEWTRSCNPCLPGTKNVWVIGSNAGLSGDSSAYVTTDQVNKPLSYDPGPGSSANPLKPWIATPWINGALVKENLWFYFNYKAGGNENCGFTDDEGKLFFSNNPVADPSEYNLAGTLGNQGNNVMTVDGSLTGSQFQNQQFQFLFQWVSDGDNCGSNPPFAIDNVKIYTVKKIETFGESASAYLGPGETIYFYSNDRDVVARVKNNSTTHDYGCTTVSITGVGEGSVGGSGDYSSYFFTKKQFLITPSNPNPDASYTVTIFFTEQEVDMWSFETGLPLSDLNIVKMTTPLSSANSTNTVVITPVVEDFSAPASSFQQGWAYSGTFNGFARYVLGNAPVNALPVEWLSFSGKKDGKTVKLNWRTAHEIHSDYFEVERSRDGVRFEKLAQVPAAGHSPEVQNYVFTDASPFAGTNYYRLKQVDADGAFQLSNVISVDFTGEIVVKIAPNPVLSDQFTLHYFSESAGELRVDIADVSGKIVHTGRYEIFEGANAFELVLPGLAEGVYFVKYQQSNQVETLRFVKL